MTPHLLIGAWRPLLADVDDPCPEWVATAVRLDGVARAAARALAEDDHARAALWLLHGAHVADAWGDDLRLAWAEASREASAALPWPAIEQVQRARGVDEAAAVALLCGGARAAEVAREAA